MTPSTLASREEQARQEIGITHVRPVVARTVVAAFLLPILAITVLEIARQRVSGTTGSWSSLQASTRQAWSALRRGDALAANRSLLASIKASEDSLDERSLVAHVALPPAQWFLTHVLGAGNEQVLVGRQGWLYFRPAVDYLTGPGFLSHTRLSSRSRASASWEPPPHPDPLPAIADFSAQLAARGVGLVVVVTPVKAAVHPEGLAPRLITRGETIENPSFDRFVQRLADLGIPVYAPSARLARARHEWRTAQFLRTDTHWTPEAVVDAARGLADLIASTMPLPERAPVAYRRRRRHVRGHGDLTGLLLLPHGDALTRPEMVLAPVVVRPDGIPWKPDAAADILVLGDSFTNIYSQTDLGWGSGAGFAEQLSFELRRPVDRIAVNAGGPSAARERLAALLASGDDRLAGKHLVAYQFSARELTSGDWRLVSLGASPPLASPGTPGATSAGSPLMRGDLYWESRRGGAWRIWTRRLEGSPPRPLTPEEPGHQHCCAHVSPAGSRVVYLSRTAPDDEYPDPPTPGELHIIGRDGRDQRTLVPARVYGWGDRAAVWRNDHQVVYVGTDGRTYLLDVDNLERSRLTNQPRGKSAWLLDATLRHAVGGAPVFSRYDATRHEVVSGRRRSGCEPYFTHDGRFGFWVARGGGPIDWIDLTTGRIGDLIARDDPRIPGRQRYVYFPMVSRDGRMLAFGASPGEHDHFRSNYDVFVAPVDPATLRLLGRPVRLTSHPGSDRYPDLHVESLALARWKREAPPIPIRDGESHAAPPASGKPFDVRATLLACSRMPTLREISPYRAALAVCEWHVDAVLRGKASEPRIRVAHWAFRDGERRPITSLAPGVALRLHVEPLAGFAQVQNYPIFDTLPRAGLPTHYASGP